MDLIKNEYEDLEIIKSYSNEIKSIGLWKSEEIMFKKYFKSTDKILDIGCGAGRTTFNLYDIGFKNIIGLDYSHGMIEKCKSYGKENNYDIEFFQGDACNLSFNNDSFDCCLFSFNGLMTIPLRNNRRKALCEIYRVLKKDGFFIFTTHNMNNPNFLEFWSEEKLKWDNNTQDSALFEYGDIIFLDELSSNGTKGFIHVSTHNEVIEDIKYAKFELVLCESREDICVETESVKSRSSDCLFWVVKKTI